MDRFQKTVALPLLVIVMLLLIGSGSARAQSEFRAVPRPLDPWQTDIYRFERELRRIVSEAQIPERTTFEKKLEKSSRDLEVITDGYGGVVDFNAAEGIVQYVANAMVQGRPIEWEFELARDAKPIYDGSIHLNPQFAEKPQGENEERDMPLLAQIKIEDSKAGPFKAGDRVRLKAYLDDFSRFRKGFRRATGLIAVHYLEEAPPVMFWIHLDKAELSLVKPTE